MTFQAYKLLTDLKKTQIAEDGQIWLDADNMLMMTVMETNNSKCIVINLSKKWNSLYSTLDYLRSQGLLNKHTATYYSLTHAGYHYNQTICTNICSFLLKSIFVPITVSAFTTVVLLMIERWLVH